MDSHCKWCGREYAGNDEALLSCRGCATLRTGKPDLFEFGRMLKSHDWAYQYADDGEAYARGVASIARITTACETSPEHRQMFLAQVNAMSSAPKNVGESNARQNEYWKSVGGHPPPDQQDV